MRIPKSGSAGDKVLRLLFERGPMSMDDILAAIPSVRRQNVHTTAFEYKLNQDKGLYSLTYRLKCYLQDGTVVQIKVDPAPNRVRNVFSDEMKGYGASLMAACRRDGAELREMSFHNGSIVGTFGTVGEQR